MVDAPDLTVRRPLKRKKNPGTKPPRPENTPVDERIEDLEDFKTEKEVPANESGPD